MSSQWRPRRGAGFSNTGNRWTSRPSASSVQSLPTDRQLTDGLLPKPLRTLPIPMLSDGDDEVAVNDFEFIGSYNWLKGYSSPTILVPGSPPEWQNKATPYQVPADIGTVFVDQNGFHMPTAVLQPLLVAVDKKAEGNKKAYRVDWPSVDFVTDRNGLRKLLRWIGGGEVKPFRIDMQLAGKQTVLFNRWEKRNRETMSGFTFGFNFEKASTTPARGCEESSGHHRIVTYDLNGLKMVVRFEVDACIPTSTASSATPKAKKAVNIDDLTSGLAGVSLSTTDPASASSPPRTLTVLSGGSDIPQSCIAELSTISERRRSLYEWKELYPQLFLSQTPHHFLGVHQSGRFREVEKRKLGTDPDFLAVANQMQESLKKLRQALEMIQELVIEHGAKGRLSLVCEDGELKVYERESQASCLPKEFIARFDS